MLQFGCWQVQLKIVLWFLVPNSPTEETFSVQRREDRSHWQLQQQQRVPEQQRHWGRGWDRDPQVSHGAGVLPCLPTRSIIQQVDHCHSPQGRVNVTRYKLIPSLISLLRKRKFKMSCNIHPGPDCSDPGVGQHLLGRARRLHRPGGRLHQPRPGRGGGRGRGGGDRDCDGHQLSDVQTRGEAGLHQAGGQWLRLQPQHGWHLPPVWPRDQGGSHGLPESLPVNTTLNDD